MDSKHLASGSCSCIRGQVLFAGPEAGPWGETDRLGIQPAPPPGPGTSDVLEASGPSLLKWGKQKSDFEELLWGLNEIIQVLCVVVHCLLKSLVNVGRYYNNYFKFLHRGNRAGVRLFL